MDGQCHTSGGFHEIDCGSLGRSKLSFFALLLRDGNKEVSSLRLSVGIGNSNVDVVGDLPGQNQFRQIKIELTGVKENH